MDCKGKGRARDARVWREQGELGTKKELWKGVVGERGDTLISERIYKQPPRVPRIVRPSPTSYICIYIAERSQQSGIVKCASTRCT